MRAPTPLQGVLALLLAMDQTRAEDAQWRTVKANTYKSGLRTWGGICGLVVVIVWAVVLIVLAILGTGFPFFPAAVLDYGWAFHLLNIFMVVLCFVAAATRSVPVISLLALSTALFIFVLNTWTLAANFIPWLVGCISGHPVTFFADCVLDSLYMVLLTLIAFLFWLISLYVWVTAFGLINYLRGSVPTQSIKQD
jgi:hypothetical protein